MAEPVHADKEQKRLIRMAETISKALPYMRRHNDATFVVKYGGHAMTDPKLGDLVARDVVLMKQVGMNPIVVHGGGPQINKMLERVGIKSTFVNGLRVTDAPTMEIVEMVLAGSINKAIVADINECGGIAVGICGKDGNLILARKVTEMRDPKTGELLKVDLKQVGEPARINVMVLDQLRRADVIPVVAPIGFGVDDELTYNINADTSAGAIAGAMKAKRLLFLTDVPGVLDKDGKLIQDMTVEQARALIADGTISGGMIPKVENCIDAVNSGVEAAVIMDEFRSTRPYINGVFLLGPDGQPIRTSGGVDLTSLPPSFTSTAEAAIVGGQPAVSDSLKLSTGDVEVVAIIVPVFSNPDPSANTADGTPVATATVESDSESPAFLRTRRPESSQAMPLAERSCCRPRSVPIH